LAPELFNGSDYDLKVDVYAYGMLLYELLTGLEPFEDLESATEIGMKVAKEEERPKIPSKVPLHIRQLITGCWKQSPEKRPTYDDVLAYLLSDNFKIPKQVDFGWLQAYEVRVIPYQFLPRFPR
jgi:serine/threonine protein kinase